MKVINIVSSISLAGLLWLFVAGCRPITSPVVPVVSAEQIMRIKPGMSLEQVLAVLGRPYSISIAAPLHNQTCTRLYSGMEQDLKDSIDIRQAAARYYSDTDYCCAANKSCRQSPEQRLTLTYTKPEPGILDYPMLWVHLDRDYRVYAVFAKRYDFLDDEAVYSCSKVKSADSQQGDTFRMWMKEALFKRCFP